MSKTSDHSETVQRVGIDRHIQFIVEHPRITLTVLFILSVLMITLPLQDLRNKAVEATALHDGIIYSDFIREVRTVYTSEVVNRLTTSEVSILHDYSKIENAIPVPAKFIEELGKKMNEIHPGIVEVALTLKEPVRLSEVLESRTLLAGLLMSFTIFFILNMMIAYLKKTSSNLREKGEELRASELKNRAILQTTPAAVITINSHGIIQLFNPAAEKIFGYREKEILFRKVNVLMPNHVAKVHDGLIKSYLETKIAKVVGIGREVMARHRDGHEFPIRLNLGEININGEFYFTAVIEDISESKRIANELLQLVQKGKMAALGELSSGIGHELNNPLHFVKGFNDLIRVAFAKNKTVSYEEIKDCVESIDRNCDRMNTIIEHFRNLTGQSEMKFRSIPINKILEDSFILFNEQMKLSSIAIIKDLSNENPHVYGDPNRLEQVFISILINAREAIEKAHRMSGGEIVISTNIDHDLVIVEIRDNGLGIAPENLDRIYNPFYTTKETGAGTGLGLSIAHGVLQDHNGRISCMSTLGGGAIFKIVLPLEVSRGEIVRAR